MQPNIVLFWPALGTAFLAAFIFGFLWYGPLFGRAWATLVGINFEQKPDAKVMRRAFALQILGTFLTVFVLAHTVQVWRPSVWNAGQDQSDLVYGWMAGFFIWLGFYVPLQFGKVAWEGRSWKLFFLNTVYDFLNLQIIAQILAHWRG